MNTNTENRPLKELFKIVKEYHLYWNRNYDLSYRYMCIAAETALVKEKITPEEYDLVLQQIRHWMEEIDQDRFDELMLEMDGTELPSIAVMLGISPYDDEIEIKAWWEEKFKELD